MAQENKITKQEVLKYFKDTIAFIENKYKNISDFEIRMKDEYVKDDLQLIGYVSDIDISIAIKYDDGKDFIYHMEIDGHTVIDRNINVNELYNYIFLLSDIIKNKMKLVELYSNKAIKKYDYDSRLYKINQLI